jgi:TRAP-type C4-dicarboxylate transport system permease small subunit
MRDAVAALDRQWRRVLHAATRVLAFVSVASIAFMMLATSADVGRRQFFGSSVRGVIELSEIMMVVIVFFGLGYAESREAHVSMTLVIRRLPARVAAAVKALALVLAIAVIGWMLVATFDRAIDSFVSGEQRFGIVRLPVWPARWAIVVGLAAFLLEMLVRLVDLIRTAWRTTPAATEAVERVEHGALS